MNFLTLPSLPGGIAIWGGGFRIDLLRHARWLADCRILYWGDIDAQGFQILSRLRSLFPEVDSVMMDLPTFEAHRAFAVDGTPCPAEGVPHLASHEDAAFRYVVEHNLRLEQEKIPQAFVRGVLGRPAGYGAAE